MNWEAKDLFDDSVMEVYECTSAMSIYPQMGCEAVIGDEIRMRSEVGRVVGSLWIGWRWSEGEWWWEGWWWGEVSHSEGLYNLWPDDLSYHQLNLSLSLLVVIGDGLVVSHLMALTLIRLVQYSIPLSLLSTASRRSRWMEMNDRRLAVWWSIQVRWRPANVITIHPDRSPSSHNIHSSHSLKFTEVHFWVGYCSKLWI